MSVDESMILYWSHFGCFSVTPESLYPSMGPDDEARGPMSSPRRSPRECNGANRARLVPDASLDAESSAADLAALALATRLMLTCFSFSSLSWMLPGHHALGGATLNLIESSSAMSLIAASASARSSLECAAETQKRMRG